MKRWLWLLVGQYASVITYEPLPVVESKPRIDALAALRRFHDLTRTLDWEDHDG